MRELRKHAEPILKVACLVLTALVVYQLVGIAVRWNPFRGVTVPALPTLAAATNSPASGGHGTNLAATATGKETNNAPHLAGTNATGAAMAANSHSNSPSTQAASETDSVAPTKTATPGTNTETKAAAQPETQLRGTNLSISTSPTNTNTAPAATSTATNPIAHVETETAKTNPGTNSVTRLETKLNGTNSAPATNSTNLGTNVSLAAAGTNAAHVSKSEKKGSNAAPGPQMAGMNFNPFQPPEKGGAELPPAVKSRISRITDSEILGPVMRPLPMALLGIAGEFAFLRSANGQTGLVKEGDALDDIKLLRIGVNRVLIEQAGEKKELMIFSGYGGDSLLQTNTPDEKKHP